MEKIFIRGIPCLIKKHISKNMVLVMGKEGMKQIVEKKFIDPPPLNEIKWQKIWTGKKIERTEKADNHGDKIININYLKQKIITKKEN